MALDEATTREMAEKAADWLVVNAAERMRDGASGRVTIELIWDNGQIKKVRYNQDHVHDLD